MGALGKDRTVWSIYGQQMCEHPQQVGHVFFLEALRIARRVMQIPIQDALLQDPQLKGRAQRLMLSRDVYRPARPMKAQEAAKIKKMMLS